VGGTGALVIPGVGKAFAFVTSPFGLAWLVAGLVLFVVVPFVGRQRDIVFAVEEYGYHLRSHTQILKSMSAASQDLAATVADLRTTLAVAPSGERGPASDPPPPRTRPAATPNPTPRPQRAPLRSVATDLPDAARATAGEVGLDADTAAHFTARYVGVCLDTAHAAVQFEPPADSLARLTRAKVRVGKVQLSSALRLCPTPEALERLEAFVDPVYLHQVKLRRADGGINSFADLPAAIEAARCLADPAACEMRVHFHVPLFFTAAGPLGSTSGLLGEDFWRALAGDGAPTDHLEIETYTFDVLPADLRPDDVAESIRREYEWVLSRWATAQE